jgi:hypothetical protein
MHYFKSFLILLLIFSNLKVFAADKKKPLFDFTIDEQIKNYKNDVNLGKSIDIKNSEYWNSPLTKLDYILMQLKYKAEETEKKFIKYEYPIKGNFEKKLEPIKYRSLSGKFKNHDVDSYIYFDENNGKIIVRLRIGDLGVPKKPMKEICEEILKYSVVGYPLPNNKMSGYTYHNSLLNELFRGGDYKDYSEELKKIADNLVYVLSLSSTKLVDPSHKTSVDSDTHIMFCWKPTGKDEFVFRKNSFSYRAK